MPKLQASGAFAQALDDNARALNGAYWKVYAAGTTTQATTYSNALLTIANAWPVIGDAAGRLPDIYVAPGNYRIRVETAGGVLIAESDNNVVYGLDPGEVAAAKFKTVAILTADETMGYALGGSVSVIVASGNMIEAGGFRYSVLASGATDSDVVTDGGVKLRVLPGADGYSVLAYAPAGDGVTDDTLPLQRAADQAKATGRRLVGAAGNYLVTSTLSLECEGDLSEMTILADGASVSPAVRFGNTSGFPTSYKRIALPRVRNSARTGGEWGEGVGIELANCNTCEITVPSATEFETGLLCGGYNSGFAYCTVNLGFIYSNKVNLRLMPAGAGGWCNQNVFIGGRLGINTADFTTSGYVGTRQIVLDQGIATNGGPNNNTFLNVSIESSQIEAMVDFQESAAYNLFINCRYEGSNKEVIFNTDTASGIIDNQFIGGYQAGSLNFTFSGSGTSLYNGVLAARSNSIDATGSALSITNRSASTQAAPHIQGFAAGTSALGKGSGATDWTYRLFALGLSGKRVEDAHPRIAVDWNNSRLQFGDGTVAPADTFARTGGGFTSSVRLLPSADGTLDLGASGLRWQTVYATTGTISTSDEREKRDIQDVSDAERAVAKRIRPRVFRWKTGDPKMQIGVIAQEVIAAFAAEGLDAMEYGCVHECEETGRLGVRMDQILALMLSAMID